ncbi:MAG: hypothetical protein ACOCP8_06955 [archaeon]
MKYSEDPTPINDSMYVTEIKGKSNKISSKKIAIHNKKLNKMDLSKLDKILLTSFKNSKPINNRKVYKLTPISKRDNSKISSILKEGGVILSDKNKKFEIGNDIIINGVLSKNYMSRYKTIHEITLERFHKKED